jgi:hypothetical protein
LNRNALWAVSLVGVLLGGYAGWLTWQASHRTTALPPPPTSQNYEKFPPFFEDVTIGSGVDFQHWCGDGGKYFFPEVMGSGIALFDYDRDGKLDLFAVQGMPSETVRGQADSPAGRASRCSRSYRQQDDGRFRDVTDDAGLTDDQPYGMGVAVGDVNNDGWPDLYVSKYGEDRLFLNQQGKFADITEAAGISNPRWGASASFLDFDRDGWLDLVVTNYVDYFPSQKCIPANGVQDYCHPNVFHDAPSRLFRNISGSSDPPRSSVQFEDVSLTSGIDGKPGPGLGVLCDDFNSDGWPDIFVANDSKANHLWINRHDGTFAEEAIPAGVAYDRAGRPQANMGIAYGDVDGNGKFDLLVTHLDGEYDTLYRQIATGIFEDRSIDSGLAPTIPPTGFGTAFADLDLDGDLDLVIGNGRVRRPDLARDAPADPSQFWQGYTERSAIFMNGGKGNFVEADPASEPFCAEVHVLRGLCTGDLDNDGDLDVVTSEVNGPVRIYRNVTPRAGHWLVIKVAELEMGGRDAIGAVVTIRCGKQTLAQTVNPGFSYLSSSDPRVHFGLGDAKKFDELLIRWPDGEVESFPGGPADRHLTIERGTGATP